MTAISQPVDDSCVDLVDCPMRGENYYRAEIVAGRVGEDQAEPKQEF